MWDAPVHIYSELLHLLPGQLVLWHHPDRSPKTSSSFFSICSTGEINQGNQ